MSWIAWLVHGALIFAMLHAIAKKHLHLRPLFWTAASLKLFAGICVGWIYLFYYGAGDTLTYFRDGSSIAALATEDLSIYARALFLGTLPDDLHLVYTTPRALFLSRVVSVFSLVTGANYWITSLWFSLASFVASWFLVTTISKSIPIASIPAVIALLFFPSVVFWTSGLLKDSIAMAAFFFMVALVVKWWTAQPIRKAEWALALPAVILFWNLKYYYLAGLLPVVLTLVIYRYFIAPRWKPAPGAQLLVFILLLVVPLAGVSLLHPNFNLTRVFQVVVENHNAYVALSAPGDVVVFNDLRAEWTRILANVPAALFAGLFRPFFWEATSALQFIAGVENAVLLLLAGSSLVRLKGDLRSPYRLLVGSVLSLVLILAVLITLSAPNFGTLSRYRAGYMALFLMVVLCGSPVLRYLQRRWVALASQ